MIQSASAFAAAARETALEQIIGLSQWLAGPNHPALTSIARTVVNPGFFADSPYMEMMPFAAHLGVFPLPVALASFFHASALLQHSSTPNSSAESSVYTRYEAG